MTESSRSASRAGNRVLVTCPTFEPGFRGGGPIRSVSQIVDTAPLDLDLVLVTRDRDLGAKEPYPGLSGQWVARSRASVFYLDTRKPSHWVRVIKQLRREPIKLMYVNSLWEPCFSLVPIALALVHALPVQRVLIAPRGELSPGALNIKSPKKRLFLAAWRPLLRHLNPLWHASTVQEADQIRSAFEFSQNSILISSDQISAAKSTASRPVGSQSRFVYIGRISPIKNLHTAIEALAAVVSATSLDIYGPIEDGKYWAKCQERIRSLPGHIKISYRGELPPDQVPATFASYEASLFPTLGENFGHAIGESLAASCPVICSAHTPWTVVLEGGGGQVVHDLTAEGLAEVLERWSSLTPDDIFDKRAAAGRAFRAWQDKQAGVNVLDLALRSIEATDASVRRPLQPRLKQGVEHLAPELYRSASRAKSFATVGLRPRATVFGSIYLKNRWGSSVSRSGTGSDLGQTSALRAALPKLLSVIDCRVLLDIPCGDFYWMARTELDLDKYIGADIVSSLIEANEREFGRGNRIFTQLDLTSGPLPSADVVLCRDGLVHLAYHDILRALNAIRASGSTYLLTTTFVGRPKNYDILTGAWRPLNLQLPPFSFPPPLRIVDEQCTEGGGRFADKSLGLWRISALDVDAGRPPHRRNGRS